MQPWINEQLTFIHTSKFRYLKKYKHRAFSVVAIHLYFTPILEWGYENRVIVSCFAIRTWKILHNREVCTLHKTVANQRDKVRPSLS